MQKVAEVVNHTIGVYMDQPGQHCGFHKIAPFCYTNYSIIFAYPTIITPSFMALCPDSPVSRQKHLVLVL